MLILFCASAGSLYLYLPTVIFIYFFPVQGAAIDRILGEIVHSKSISAPIDYVLCIGHFLGKVYIYIFSPSEVYKSNIFLLK